MKPNVLVLAFALLCLFHPVNAQEVRFTLGPQYATYAMNDLKDFQTYLRNPDFLDLKEKEAFSPSLGIQGSFVYIGRKRMGAGIEFGHYATSGKVVGENPDVFYFQHHAWSSTLGGTVFFILNKLEQPFEISLSVSTGGTLNKFRRRYPDLEGGPQTTRYISRSIYAACGPTVTRKFKYWFVNARVQYFYDFGGRLKQLRSSETYFLDESGDALSLDWTGLRFSLGVGARLSY